MTADDDMDLSGKGGLADVTATFAGVLLMLASFFDILQGASAVHDDELFAAGTEYLYKIDVTAWGWLHIVIGVIGVVVSIGILLRKAWGQLTGMVVAGTAANPVIYVASSDPRIGGGSTGEDKNLDTNSGILSRLTWNGSQWVKLDLVRGLPRSEENHHGNGLVLNAQEGVIYLAYGGNTNRGGPSNNFALPTATSCARWSQTSQYPSHPTSQSSPTRATPVTQASQRERVKRRAKTICIAWSSAKSRQASEL